MGELILRGTVSATGQLNGMVSVPQTIYEFDYENLENKPSINSKILIGDKSFDALGMDEYLNKNITSISNFEVENMFK